MFLNNDSIFKVYQWKDESFIYSVLAALDSKTMDRRLFHRPTVYEKYKRKLNLENITFPMKNKDIEILLKNNPNLNLRLRLFDSIMVSKNDMKIYESKVIGKGQKNCQNIISQNFQKQKNILPLLLDKKY